MNREIIRKKIILFLYWWQSPYKIERGLKVCEPNKQQQQHQKKEILTFPNFFKNNL